MDHMDIFGSDAFGMVSMTAMVNAIPYVPGFVSSLGIFEERGVTTTTIDIERQGTTLSLINTSARGSAPSQRVADRRTLRSLKVPHLARSAVVYAEQVQNVRAFGSANALQTVQQIVNQEVSAVTLELDMTLENLRLGAIKGVIVDADSSTIYNLFTEFGVSQVSEWDMELDVATTDVRGKCAAIVRSMAAEIAAGGMQFQVHALCSHTFFDTLVSHALVRDTYLYTQQASELRGSLAFQSFTFGGITFHDYRGTDDGSTIAIASGKAHFFPVGVPGLFINAFSPADRFETVNSMGLPRYALPHLDDRGRFFETEIQSNPLPFCTKPRVLQIAKAS